MVDRLELEVHLPRLDTSEVADLETEQLGSVLLGHALGLVKGAQITANILLKRTSEDGEAVWLRTGMFIINHSFESQPDFQRLPGGRHADTGRSSQASMHFHSRFWPEVVLPGQRALLIKFSGTLLEKHATCGPSRVS